MTTVNPNTLKFMQYGLPSLMGIWLLFMPGALQLTIFVSSLFAFFQSSLLRNEKVRHWLNIQSLPRPSPTDPAFADVHASTMTRYEAPRLPTAVDPTAKTVETKTSEIKSMYRKLVDNLPGKAQVEEQMEKAKTKNQIAEVRAFEKQFREKKVAKAIKEKWNVKR